MHLRGCEVCLWCDRLVVNILRVGLEEGVVYTTMYTAGITHEILKMVGLFINVFDLAN